MRAILLSLILFLLTAFSAQAITIDVDGKLSDWWLSTDNITTNFDENGNNWDPGIPGIFVWQEDCVGYDCSGADSNDYVGPGYGGQKYDVEAILATFDADYLYIAIVTGFPQDGIKIGCHDWYDAGDIFLDIGNDDNWDYAFVVSNYDNGSETRELVLGGLYKVSSWQQVSVEGHQQYSDPWRMDNGTYVGTGSLAYVDDPDHDFSRYFIEVGIPLELLGNFTEVKIHWTMECGNDYGEVVAHTPEPASILLLGAGLFAVGIVVRRRKS